MDKIYVNTEKKTEQDIEIVEKTLRELEENLNARLIAEESKAVLVYRISKKNYKRALSLQRVDV